MSIFDKLMATEHKVEKMTCNCQQAAEEWLKEQEAAEAGAAACVCGADTAGEADAAGGKKASEEK